MKRTIALIAILAFACLMVFAGGDEEKSSAPAKASGDRITLTVWGSQEDQAMLKEMCNAYAAAHPENNYKFLYGVQSESDAADKVLNDPESGPDVFAFASDQINKLIQAGALARVGGAILDDIKAVNSPESIDAATVTISGEERTYAFPMTGDNTYFLYYDSSKLSAEDVKSLDKMLEVAAATGKQVAFKLYDDGWYLSSFFFADPDLGYKVTYTDDLTEQSVIINYDNANGLAVMKALRSYFANPALSANVDDSKIIAGIQSGTIIAAVSGTWNMKAIQDVWKENMAVAVMPTATIGDKEILLNGYFGYKLIGVNGYSQNKSEALKLAQWLTNEQNQLLRFQTRGFGPTNKAIKASSEVQNDKVISVVLKQSEYFRTQKGVPGAYWTPMASLTKQFADVDPMTVSDADLQALLDSLCAQIRK
ncbi:MAG: extracellular solute-binding protein [Sphaerochaetaceae bacterium]|nr:extracellular solute-binding protein [Sphaerochaetaceae bacterium]